MQLQVECNNLAGKQQFCYLCDRSFETKEARVIVCNEQGTGCGEVCPECLKQGFDWLNYRFRVKALSNSRKLVRNARSRQPEQLLNV